MNSNDPESAPLSSLNAQLVAHGYTKRPLKLTALSNADQAHVSSVICELLGASVSNLNSLEDLNARHRTLQYEHERLAKTIEKGERQVARLESDVEVAKARAVEAERRVAVEEEKVKHLREDVNRGRKAVDNLRVAAVQEAKRSQIKLDKVLGQLARTIPAVPVGFELLNPLPAGGTAPVAPGPLPLLEQALADLADIRQSLQEETEAFRTVVLSAANSLQEALSAGMGDEPPHRMLQAEFFAMDTAAFPGHRGVRQQASWTSHPAIADARLKALIADVRVGLTTEVSPLMRDGSGATEAEAEEQEAAAKRERERQRAESDLRDRVKDLEVEIAIARGKEQEANKVIEEMAKMNVGASVPSTTDFEDARLRDELVRQKRVLDNERDALRTATIRLTEDRVALHSAKAVFEADREAAIAAAVEAATPVPAANTSPIPVEAGPSSPQPPTAHALPLNPVISWEKSSTPQKHKPSSPSPLSPHKLVRRTPSGSKQGASHVHVAGKRKPRNVPRTPLSRLVLERAVLDRDRARKTSGGGAGAVGKASESGNGNGNGNGVLGESGKRVNLATSTTESSVTAAPSGLRTGKARLSGDKPRIAFSPEHKGKAVEPQRRVSGPPTEKPERTAQPPSKTEPRKSSLTAMTAASAARAKEMKEMKDGRNQEAKDAGAVRSAAKTARVWR